MRITQAPSAFRKFLRGHGKSPKSLLPEELLTLGFAFYKAERVSDALPATAKQFGDALLFQWGTAPALKPHRGDYYYFDLTRQFISKKGQGDDAIFQLTFELQYALTPALRKLEGGDRWCASLAELPKFKAFAFAHPALAAVAGKPARAVEFYLDRA